MVDAAAWARLRRKAPRVQAGELVRVVKVANAVCNCELALGANGRARHVQHASLARSYQAEDVLHVRWDAWRSELFLRRDGVFGSVGTLGLV